MTKHVFLMDVTRHKGPMQGILQTARAHAGSFQESKLIWFHAPTQTIEAVEGEEYIVSEPDTSLDILTSKLQALSSNGEAEALFHVMSHDGATLRGAAALKTPNVKLKTESFASLKRSTLESANSSFAAGIAQYEPLPLDEAVQLTQEVLKALGHTSFEKPLLLNRLRGVLERRDRRAHKNPYMYKSKSLITDIVGLGLKDGWLGRRLLSSLPGTEAIWLIESNAAANDEKVQPINEAAKRAEEKTHAIVSYLKSKRLYAPKDIRDLILKQLLLVELNEVSVSKLFRFASVAAQKVALSDGLTFEHWRPAVDSITNLAIRAGIFLDVDGRVIADTFASRGTIVGKVKPDVIDVCDGCLLVATIEGIQGLTTRDAPSIAHAIFKEAPIKISQDDMIDRVHDVLSQLAGKLDQDADGKLSVI
jgi:hypothetical protein